MQRFLYLILIPLFLFTTCKKDDDDQGQNQITLGALISITGQGSSIGESSQAALNLAIDDINQYLASIGSDKQIIVLLEDTQTDTATGLQKIKELHDEGVQVIIGPFSSAVVNSVKNYSDQNDIVVISPASVATSLSIKDDNIFRLVPALNTQAEALNALLEDDGIKVLAPIVRDDLWGNELLEATSQLFSQKKGGTILEPVMYDPSSTDFSSSATQLELKVQQALAQYDPDEVGVYMLSYAEGKDILNAAVNSQPLQQVRWYGSSGFAENKSLPSDHNAASLALSTGLMCPSYGFDQSAKEKWQPLVTRISNEIGRAPEIYALITYDAAWLAVITYLRSGLPVTTEKYKDTFLHEAGNYFGVTGWTKLNDAGDRAYATYDFWGIRMNQGAYEWQICARYDNATGELTRY